MGIHYSEIFLLLLVGCAPLTEKEAEEKEYEYVEEVHELKLLCEACLAHPETVIYTDNPTARAASIGVCNMGRPSKWDMRSTRCVFKDSVW